MKIRLMGIKYSEKLDRHLLLFCGKCVSDNINSLPINEELVEKTVELFSKYGGSCYGFVADITIKQGIVTNIKEIEAQE